MQIGISTDKPVSADYNNDSRADQGVYWAGAWYLLLSQTGVTAFLFGIASDIPAPADYDGDGRTEDGLLPMRLFAPFISTIRKII